MTQSEEIMQTVANLVREGRNEFSRRDIREQLGIVDDRIWQSYDTMFQTMRRERIETPDIEWGSARFRGVFRQVRRGVHTLTNYGRQLLAEFNG